MGLITLNTAVASSSFPLGYNFYVYQKYNIMSFAQLDAETIGIQ